MCLAVSRMWLDGCHAGNGYSFRFEFWTHKVWVLIFFYSVCSGPKNGLENNNNYNYNNNNNNSDINGNGNFFINGNDQLDTLDFKRMMRSSEHVLL